MRPEHQAPPQELAAAERKLDLPGQEAQLQAAQAELAAAEMELAALDKASEQLSLQESQYWHEFNNFQACLATHVDDRDGMLTKVCTWSPCRPARVPSVVLFTCKQACRATLAPGQPCPAAAGGAPRIVQGGAQPSSEGAPACCCRAGWAAAVP